MLCHCSFTSIQVARHQAYRISHVSYSIRVSQVIQKRLQCNQCKKQSRKHSSPDQKTGICIFSSGAEQQLKKRRKQKTQTTQETPPPPPKIKIQLLGFAISFPSPPFLATPFSFAGRAWKRQRTEKTWFVMGVSSCNLFLVNPLCIFLVRFSFSALSGIESVGRDRGAHVCNGEGRRGPRSSRLRIKVERHDLRRGKKRYMMCKGGGDCLVVASLAQRVAQPFQTLVQTITGGSAGGLDVLEIHVRRHSSES